MKYKYKTQEFTLSGSLKPDNSFDALDKERYLAIEAARTAWEYQTELLSPISLNNIGDYQAWILALARKEVVKCLAYKDDGSQLTAATSRYWKIFPKAKLIPKARPRSYSIGGKLGSLAAYACIHDNWPSSDVELMRSICSRIWEELLVSSKLSPLDKLSRLFSNLDLNFDYVNRCERALKLRLKTGDFELRRWALDENAFDRLGLRLLLGEISDAAVRYWAEFHISANQNPNLGLEYGLPNSSYQRPYSHLQFCTAIGYSAGFSFLLQALYIERLLAIYDLLATQSKALPLDIFKRDPNFVKQREELSKNFDAAAGAVEIQSTFGAIASANNQSQLLASLAKEWGSFSDPKLNVKFILN